MALNKRRFISNKVGTSCSMPGVWKAVYHNEGCVVIYHAPHSCAHITGEMERNRYFRTMARGEYEAHSYTAPLIVSGLGSKESVFGGTEKLKDCLAYVIANYKPSYIVVANSCVAGIIGDDTESICRDAEVQYGIPILAVDSYGFLDDEYYGGYIGACKLLIDRFVISQPKDKSAGVIIGEKDGPRSLAVQDFCELLVDFGITVHKNFPGYCTITEMEEIGSCSYSFLLGGTPKASQVLKSISLYLEEKAAVVPFSLDYPIGWRKTKQWIEQLGSFLGKEELVIPSIKRLEEKLVNGYQPYKDVLQKVPIALYIGKNSTDLKIEWLLEWIELGQLHITRVILMDQLTDIEKEEMRMAILKVMHCPIEIESSDTKINPDEIIITTHEIDNNQCRQLLLPMLPPVGSMGFLQIYKKLFMVATHSGPRGVVLYGW